MSTRNYRIRWLWVATCFCLYVLSAKSHARTLLPALEYQELHPRTHQFFHILIVDPEHFLIRTQHANQTAFGRKTLTEMAVDLKAIAAINGGFFKGEPDIDGLPAGILKIENTWYGIAYQQRGAIGWSEAGKVALIDRLQTKSTLITEHARYPIHLLNRPMRCHQAALYTSPYHTVQTAFPAYHATLQDQKVQKSTLTTDSTVTSNQLVYTLGRELSKKYPPLTRHEKAMVQIEILPDFNSKDKKTWQQLENIVGGGPVLIKNNKLITDYTKEKMHPHFLYKPHARTAVGLLPNGHWLFFTTTLSSEHYEKAGLTIPELAKWMLHLGCIDAVNLDGGKSTSFYLDTQFINEEMHLGIKNTQKISDGIFILSRSS